MRSETFTTSISVGLGAGLGAVTRWLVVLAAPPGSVEALALTFAVNAAGCFAMGYAKPGLFWGTGFLGGLTTFSAIGLAAVQTSISGALAIMVLSFAVSLAAWFAGDAVRGRARG